MTDVEFRTQKARILRFYHKWHGPAGLEQWYVRHSFYRNGTAGESGSPAGWSTQARAEVKWEYLNVMFHWNLEQLAEEPDDRAEEVVRHEICHVLVNEMRCWAPPKLEDEKIFDAMQHEERVVSVLQSVLLWAYQAGARSAKPKRRKQLPLRR